MIKKGAASDRALVLVANFSDEPLTIPKSTVLGVAESVLETWVNLVNSDRQTTAKVPTEPRRKEGSKALYRKLLQGKAGHLSQEVDRLRASLKNAYKAVSVANRTAHQTNKRYYNRRARNREFQVDEWVYFYNPARKPGLSRKFFKPWSGIFQIMAKVSDLNYEILGHKDRKLVVHVNRLKAAGGYDGREPKPRMQRKRRTRKHQIKEVQKRRKTTILDIAHIRHSESTNVKYKTHVTCEITLHVVHTVNTE